MIKARDIRIGDLVLYDDRKWKIKGITEQELELEKSGQYKKVSPEEVNPIILTEDILIKLGFEASEQECKHGKPYKEYNYNGIVINLFILSEPIFLYCPDDTFEGHTVSYSRPPLRYLHQLQNLFYVLTNKELDIIF